MRFSVLAELFCGFAILDDFFFGFAVSNTPHCPPLQSLVGCDSRSVLRFVGRVHERYAQIWDDI